MFQLLKTILRLNSNRPFMALYYILCIYIYIHGIVLYIIHILYIVVINSVVWLQPHHRINHNDVL